jgi:outer membrane murein-binding lipoprotein Lpp
MHALTNHHSEGEAMSSKEGASEEPSLGEIRSDVRHLQSGITDLKAEVRATNQKVDGLRVELTARIDRLDAKVEAKVDSLRTNFNGKIDALRDSLSSAKIWALLLYFGLAGGMLYTMARGFKWL